MKILNTREAADYLGITIHGIKKAKDRGHLIQVLPGYFTQQELDRYHVKHQLPYNKEAK